MPPPTMNLKAAASRSRAPRVAMHYEISVQGEQRRVELPFVTGVISDLSGKPSEALPRVNDRRFVEIDRDNFDLIVASIGPRLLFRVPNTLTGEGELAVELRFEAMLDFEPMEVLWQIVPLQLLYESLTGLDAEPAAQISARMDEQLSLIFHHPDFQRLEASWRALHRLVLQTETDDLLKIKILNLAKNDLRKTLLKFKGTAWDQSPIFKKLYSEGFGRSGGEPYGCVVLDFEFDQSPPDGEMLGELAKIARSCHAPMLAAASPALLQMESWLELSNPRNLTKIFQTPEYAAWRSLRETDDSCFLVLTLPHYLLRAPYGRTNSEATIWDFDEAVQEGDRRCFLWGNAAFLFAENIHRAFKIHGWCARITGLLGGAVEGLPRVRVRTENGTVEDICATELTVDDRRQAELVNCGLLALVARGDESCSGSFISAVSINKPAEYDDPDATANARLAAQLPYLFASCRLAHYLKAIGRDIAPALGDLNSVQAWLENWAEAYVDPPPDSPQAFSGSPRPLAALELKVVETLDQPGRYTTTFRVRPKLY